MDARMSKFTCRKFGEPETERVLAYEEDDESCPACDYVHEYFPCNRGDEVFVEVLDGQKTEIRHVTVLCTGILLACVEATLEEARKVIAEHAPS
jgi:hypothetical protein